MEAPVKFSTFPGSSKLISIDGIGIEDYAYQVSSTTEATLKRGLLVLKAADTKEDYLYSLIHGMDGRCGGVTIEVWSILSNRFYKNMTIIDRSRTTSDQLLNANRAVLVFFQINLSQEFNGFKVSYFTTTKGRG